MSLRVLLFLLVSSVASAQDWPMYGNDLKHSFTNASMIDASNVSMLTSAWSFTTGDAVSATPAVVGGVVYVGSWDGSFYALDSASGALIWSFPVDCDGAIQPIPARCPGGPSSPADRAETDGGLITSSATVVGGRVYFAGGKTIYCLNAADGSLVWKQVICGNPDAVDCASDANDPTRIFSSPAVFKHRVIVGTTPDGANGYRGGIVALDSRTGRQRWRFEVDPVVDINGKPVRVGRTTLAQNRGCGSVWSSGAVDAKKRLVVFGTGDCDSGADAPYHEAILALRPTSGKLRWAYRPRQSDTCDFDFGASANIIDIGANLWVGVGGKDGTYYVLNRATKNPGGELVWQSRVVFGGSAGGFIGSTAFDGQRVYGATAFGELGNTNGVCDPTDPRDTVLQEPAMHAFDPVAHTVPWETNGPQGVGASSVTNDVVFAGEVEPGALNAFDAQTGMLLTTIPTVGSVDSGAAIVGNSIYFGSGDSESGAGSAVHAYRLP